MENLARVGIISDTHGLLRPEALEALHNVEYIIHAGDIGNPGILQTLGDIAPVIAVRGNNDRESWADGLPVVRSFEIAGAGICLLHDIKDFDANLTDPGCRIVITGHSHRPSIETKDGILFINPGSAGPRRFKLPVSVAVMNIRDGEPRAEICLLNPPQNPPVYIVQK